MRSGFLAHPRKQTTVTSVEQHICTPRIGQTSLFKYKKHLNIACTVHSVKNQHIKPTLHELEYIRNRCTKSPPVCFDAPCAPSSGSLHTLQCIKITLLRNTECTHTMLPGLYPYLGSEVTPGLSMII